MEHAATRVLSADVESLIDLPIFDNSSMDGFAIRASDITKAKPDNPVFMKVVTDIPAGVEPPGVINMNEGSTNSYRGNDTKWSRHCDPGRRHEHQPI